MRAGTEVAVVKCKRCNGTGLINGGFENCEDCLGWGDVDICREKQQIVKEQIDLHRIKLEVQRTLEIEEDQMLIPQAIPETFRIWEYR